jgi:hypothetical protein
MAAKNKLHGSIAPCGQFVGAGVRLLAKPCYIYLQLGIDEFRFLSQPHIFMYKLTFYWLICFETAFCMPGTYFGISLRCDFMIFHEWHSWCDNRS